MVLPGTKIAAVTRLSELGLRFLGERLVATKVVHLLGLSLKRLTSVQKYCFQKVEMLWLF